MPNFKVTCGVDGCPDKHTKMNSFRKHLRTCHAKEYSGNLQAEVQPRNVNEDPPIESNSARESEVDDYEDDDDVFNPVMHVFLNA